MAATHKFLIMVNPVDGQDDALNEWLDTRHIPEVLTTPGFLSCTRYQLTEGETNPRATHKYMHVYDVETDDLDKTKAAMAEAYPTRTPLSPALQLSDMFAVWYKAR